MASRPTTRVTCCAVEVCQDWVCGIIAGGIIAFEMLLWPRKAFRAWRLIATRHWMAAHLWLGYRQLAHRCVALRFSFWWLAAYHLHSAIHADNRKWSLWLGVTKHIAQAAVQTSTIGNDLFADRCRQSQQCGGCAYALLMKHTRSTAKRTGR